MDRLDIASYYAGLMEHGGAERQWAAEILAFRAAGVRCVGLAHHVSPEVLSELGLAAEDVDLLPAENLGQRVAGVRRWLRERRPSVFLSHSSHQLVYLATRGGSIPYILYQNSPPFYGDFSLNPFPLAWRHRKAYRQLATATPGFMEFHKPPANFGFLQRSRLEVRAMLEAMAMRAAAGIFVLSRRSASEIRALYHVDAQVIRGCLDAGPYQPPNPVIDVRSKHALPAGPVYLSVCRLERVKRIDLLIRAFHRIREKIPNASLILVGTGSEARALRELAASLDLQTVVFAGFIGENELASYYAASDLFLAPATADFNIAPYEAVARGLQTVVSDELEIEGWILESGWIRQVPPTVDGFAEGISAARRGEKPQPIDLTPLSWSARVERIIQYLRTRGLYRATATTIASQSDSVGSLSSLGNADSNSKPKPA